MTAIFGYVAHIVTSLSYPVYLATVAALGWLLHFPAPGALDGIEADGDRALNTNLK
jgi:hypothetical protein